MCWPLAGGGGCVGGVRTRIGNRPRAYFLAALILMPPPMAGAVAARVERAGPLIWQSPILAAHQTVAADRTLHGGAYGGWIGARDTGASMTPEKGLAAGARGGC